MILRYLKNTKNKLNHLFISFFLHLLLREGDEISKNTFIYLL